jgi:alpha-tubulin suppressor-like RCC1 family protein
LKVCCGDSQTFCITQVQVEEDLYREVDWPTSVYAWGNNKENRLGLGTDLPEIVKQPTLMQHLEGKEITEVSSGTNHTFALSE